MYFQIGHLYHIYNQGNNKQKIFFTHDNHLFFLRKIHNHILPFCDVLAWCLMPNHFHLMVRVNCLEYSPSNYKQNLISHSESNKKQTLNNSIATMLRSYTRAINKQEQRSGSLFREGTKAECITFSEEITPSYLKSNAGIIINVETPEQQYPQICFDYIHQNPLKAGLVKSIFDWEFSSAKDVIGKRNGQLINRTVIKEYGLIIT